MSSRPAVESAPLTRERIAAIVGGDQRAVKWFETLIRDVLQILPEATMSAQDAADTAAITASAARAIAEDALAEVEQAQIDGDTARSIASAALGIAQVAADSSELAHHLLTQVGELRDTIAGLVRRIEDLENRP